MNTLNTRVIRSAVIVVVGLTLYVASYWFSGRHYASTPHTQQVGYVDDGSNSTERDYVLTIQNETEAPWLIVTQRFRQQLDLAPFTTEINSTTDVVTVDGIAYSEIEGETTIVLSSLEGKLMHKVPRHQSPALAMLGRTMGDVRVVDFETLLPKPRSGEPYDATESR